MQGAPAPAMHSQRTVRAEPGSATRVGVFRRGSTPVRYLLLVAGSYSSLRYTRNPERVATLS
jgi:hypothetical protein